MGILDEAIKEHLELKRQHGAAEDELKQLEDEAFGAAERPGGEATPDPAAEAPTEFMAQPDLEQPPDAAPEVEEQAPAGEPEAEAPSAEESARPAPRTELADLQEAPPAEAEQPAAEEEADPADEEQPAAEHEIVGGPTTAEREAIAEQPTELHDVEAEMGEEEDEYEEDDDFWDEKRLSDELDQALEAPSEDEPQAEAASEDSGEDEDVLEETPDFLEEAPEDDQLWFEQKPPKDFDFDD